MLKSIGVTDLQRRFRSVFDEVVEAHIPYVLTRGSRPQAALIPYEEYVRYQQLTEDGVLRGNDEMSERMAERQTEYFTRETESRLNEVPMDLRLALMGVSREKIEEFCHRNRVRKLSLFGSVTRDDFRTDSDIDILVEFDPHFTPGFAFFSMQSELSHLFGRQVDLHTAGFLGDDFRDDVLEQAEVCYVAA